MFRKLSLALLVASLCACATTPKTETESLVENVVEGVTPETCAAATYCLATATRIAGNEDRMCSCNAPAALYGIPVGR
jgi:hypothetical protein